MNLMRCFISGFGKLVDLPLRFGPGLNIVFAPNEGGKSTLQQFLLGLLYGPLRPGMKSQRRTEPWADAYRPWRGGEYGGVLWCALGSGGEIEVRRRFGRDDHAIEIRSGNGEDVTRRYVQQKNSEVLFAQALLGMPKELFESIAIVRENRAGEIGSTGTIRDRIANLATTGDEQISIQASLDRLDAALEAIGSDRAPTRPYRQAQDRLAALGRERSAVDARRAECDEWIAELARLTRATADLERRHGRAELYLAAARRRDAAATVRSLEEVVKTASDARLDIEVSPFREFPVESLQELENLTGGFASVELRLQETRDALEGGRARIEEARVAREPLARFAALEPESDSRQTTEQLVRYADAAALKRGAMALIEKTRTEAAAVKAKVEVLPPPLDDASVDWLDRGRKAAEKELAASQSSSATGTELVRLDRELAEQRTRCAWMKALLGAAAAGLLVVGGMYLSGAASPLGAGLAGAVLAAVAAVAGYRLAGMTRELRRLASEVQSVERRHTSARREAEAAPRDLQAAATAIGAGTVEEFLARAREAANLRLDLSSLEERAAELEAKLRTLSREEQSAHTQLEQRLSAVGVSCPRDPDEARERVDGMLEKLRRFRELDAAHVDCGRRVEALAEQEALLVAERARLGARRFEILAQAGVDSVEAFREGCQGRERVRALAERAAELDREFRRLARGRGLEDWRAEVDAFDDDVRAAAEAPPADPPPTSEAERQERSAAAELASVRERHARLAERVEQAFQNYRPLSEIEEDVAEAERELARLSVDRQALTLARETLDTLRREQQEVLAPQLNRAVEARFLRIGAGRYSAVKITPAFDLLVREADNSELRDVECLSRGTRDQLYLALRFALLDLVTEGYEASPCLLDEPFAAYDRTRLDAAFEVVKEEATRRQIFLFTCRTDVYERALEEGAWVVGLSAPADAHSLSAGAAAVDRPR